MEKAFSYPKMGRSMKETLLTIKKMVTAAKYRKMGIFMPVNSFATKNMAKDHFIGLIYVNLPVSKIQNPKYNSIMENGGVDFPMDQDNIKKPMVISIFI